MTKDFEGQYYFLSNSYEVPVTYRGATYRNAEAAFQAQRTFSDNNQFTNLNATAAKELGKKIPIRFDWKFVQARELYGVVQAKFAQNPELREKLVALDDKCFVGINPYSEFPDGFFAEILMTVRGEFDYDFDAKYTRDEILGWIQNFFEMRDFKAIVELSDNVCSSVTAALCAQALGKDRVIGVLTQSNSIERSDFLATKELISALGICVIPVNVVNTMQTLVDCVQDSLGDYKKLWAKEYLFLRFCNDALHIVKSMMNGLIVNCSSLSEIWVGLRCEEKGDFSPLDSFTVTEIKAIGYELGLPEIVLEKETVNRYTNRSDEEILGFSYSILDSYLRTGKCVDNTIRERIDFLNEIGIWEEDSCDS